MCSQKIHLNKHGCYTMLMGWDFFPISNLISFSVKFGKNNLCNWLISYAKPFVLQTYSKRKVRDSYTRHR